MQSVYSTALADLATNKYNTTILNVKTKRSSDS